MKIDLFRNFVNQDYEIWRALKRLPRPDKDGPWLAGGSVWKAIENWPIKHDLDFFFKNAEQLDHYKRVMQSIPYCYHVISEKENKYNTTYQYHVHDKDYDKTIAVQFVSFKYWDCIEELLNGFDFTVCQFGFDGENLFAGDDSFEDLRSRVIKFCSIRDTIATAIHVKKYLDKGFAIALTDIPKFDEILEALNKSPKPKKVCEDDSYPRPVDIDRVSPGVSVREVNFDPIFTGQRIMSQQTIEIDVPFEPFTTPQSQQFVTQYATHQINSLFYGTVPIGGAQQPTPTTQQNLVSPAIGQSSYRLDDIVAVQPMTPDTLTIPMTVRLTHPNSNLEIIGEL